MPLSRDVLHMHNGMPGCVLRTDAWFVSRSAGCCRRTFVLPDNVNPDAITAALDKGVLSVSIPKVPEVPRPEPKRISVVATPPAA